MTPTSIPTAIPVPAGAVATRYPVTVLGKVGQPAELCLGGVADSLPPQCGGPVLDGFDFADHEGDFEEASDVRWGEFAVTGTFDGKRFKVSTVVPADEFEMPDDREEPGPFTTPCPTPEGGWRILDPDKASEADMYATFEAASQLPGYADAWMDQSRNPDYGKPDQGEGTMNVPEYVTINVRVTGDIEAADKELRKLWGGALCVTKATYTEKDLNAIQEEINELPGMLSSGAEEQVMQVYVTYDDGTLQAWADSEYGPGLVKISSALVPASG